MKRESKNPLKKLLFNRTKDEVKKVKTLITNTSKRDSLLQTLNSPLQTTSTKTPLKTSNIEPSILNKRPYSKNPLGALQKSGLTTEAANSQRLASTKGKPLEHLGTHSNSTLSSSNQAIARSSLTDRNENTDVLDINSAKVNGTSVLQRSFCEKSINQSPRANNIASSFVSASRRTNLAAMNTTPRSLSIGQNNRSQSAHDKETRAATSKSPKNTRYSKNVINQSNAGHIGAGIEPDLFEIAETDRIDESELVVNKKVLVKTVQTETAQTRKTPNNNKSNVTNVRPVTANNKTSTGIKTSTSQLKKSPNPCSLSKPSTADPKNSANLSAAKDLKNLPTTSITSPQHLKLPKTSFSKHESNPNSTLATPKRSRVQTEFSKFENGKSVGGQSPLASASSKGTTAFSFPENLPQKSEVQDPKTDIVSNKIKIFEIMSKACES